MILGLSSYTFGWAVGVPGHAPARPLDENGLLDQCREHGIKLLQIGDNLPLHTFDATVFTRMRKYRGHDPAQRLQEARPRVVVGRVARTLRAYKNHVAGLIKTANRLDTAEVAENRPRCLYLLPAPA